MSNKYEATWHPNAAAEVPPQPVYYSYVQRQLHQARAERDALAYKLAEVRAWREAEYHEMHASDFGEFCAGCDQTNRLADILDAAPAISLALHDAEVKAQALDAAADAGTMPSARGPIRSWLHALAAAIREEVK